MSIAGQLLLLGTFVQIFSFLNHAFFHVEAWKQGTKITSVHVGGKKEILEVLLLHLIAGKIYVCIYMYVHIYMHISMFQNNFKR